MSTCPHCQHPIDAEVLPSDCPHCGGALEQSAGDSVFDDLLAGNFGQPPSGPPEEPTGHKTVRVDTTLEYDQLPPEAMPPQGAPQTVPDLQAAEPDDDDQDPPRAPGALTVRLDATLDLTPAKIEMIRRGDPLDRTVVGEPDLASPGGVRPRGLMDPDSMTIVEPGRDSDDGGVVVGGSSHFGPRNYDKTVDSGFLTREDTERMTGIWASRTSASMNISASIKAVGPPSHKDSKLVIKTRALRNLKEPQSRASDYELLEVLGEGGMGVVYSARQASIDRTVAVKMLKPDISKNRDQREKFLSEAVVTGDLDHPNIVPIYDLGANETGALFYSMKRVEGTPWIKAIGKKSLVENLEILMKVADAVAFAHARGVIHRDLKPENVMLGEFGEVLVMDWGLALSTTAFRKAASITQSGSMGGTPAYMAPEMAAGPIERIGAASDIYLLGAVLYEIITGHPPHTGRTVMKCLYAAAQNQIQATEYTGELLSVAMTAMATNPAERYADVRAFQNALREYQSHADSIVLSNRAESDLAEAEESGDYQVYSRSLFAFQEALALWQDNTRARAGLSNAKLAYARQALKKNDFDLGLSLLDEHEPAHVQLAKELSKAQDERDARQQRLKNAKRVVGGLAAAMAVVVTTALIEIRSERDKAKEAEAVATDERDNAREAEARSRQSEKEAQESALLAKQSAKQARQAEGQARDSESLAVKSAKKAREAETQARAAEKQARRDRDLAQEAKNREEYESYVARIGLVAAKIDENAFDKARELLEECKPEFRHWEWGRLMYLCDQNVQTFAAGAPVDAVALMPDEKRFVAGSWDGKVRIWNRESGQVERELPYGGLYVHGVAVSPDGRWVAAVGNDPQGYVKVFDAATGELKQRLNGHTDSVLSVVFSRDSKRLLTSSYDKTARLWDLETGRPVQTFNGHTWWVWSAAFSPDEKRIVTASQDGKTIVWNVATGEAGPPFTGHTGPVYSAVFSPDGHHVASAGYDKRVLVWEPDRVKPFDFDKVFSEDPNPTLNYRALDGHSAAVRVVRYSPDNRVIVSGGHDNTLRVWDAQNGKLLKTLRGHAGWARSCALAADGNWLLSGSHDELVKLWDIEGYEEERVLQARMLSGHSDAVLSAHFAPDGRSVATSSRDRTAKTWDTRSGREVRSFDEGHEFLASTALFFPDGKRLLTSAADNTARIWDVETGTQLLRLDRTGRTAAAALSHQATQVLTGGDARRAKLWDAKTGKLVHTLPAHKSDVTAVAFSPDDKLLLVGDSGGHLQLYGADSGEAVREFKGHSGRITAAVFLADGRRLLTASSDKTVGQWDVATGREHTELSLRHPEPLTSLVLAPDGKHVVTLCDDGIVRVWNLEQAKLVRTVSANGNKADSLSISPDGRRALTVNSRDRTVRQWDLATGQAVAGPARGGAVVALKAGLIWTAVYSVDGNYLLTVGGNSARMWELATGMPAISFSPHGAVASANFSADGSRLVTASWDNSAKIWDAATGQALAKLEGAHQGYVNCAVFSPDGKSVLTASDDFTAKLWSVETAGEIGVLAGHENRVRSAAFSSDGRQAVTASSDKTARIWDVKSRKQTRVLEGHTWGLLCAAFSRAADRVITGSEDNTARIWNAKTGEELIALKGHTASVSWVALSPDGRRALTASQDNTAKLWDAQTGKELLTLRGHTQEVTAAEFSFDGLHALTGSRDGTAIVWLAVDWTKSQPPVKAKGLDADEPAVEEAALPAAANRLGDSR